MLVNNHFGENMEEIFGKFEYEGNDYAFAYKDYVITIVSAGYEYSDKLSDRVCNDVLYGITKDNKWIMFFGCKFYNSAFTKIATHVTTHGCIILNCQTRPNENQLFNQISFYSPAINDFYPPQTAVKQKSKRDNIDDFSIELNESKDITRIIELDNCKMVLGFYLKNKYGLQNNDVLNCIPCISFVFAGEVGINELKEYYLKLSNFLSFINFNRNIPFDKIEIITKNEGHTVRTGVAYINSTSKKFDSRKHKAILANNFESAELASLFKQVSRNDDIRRHYYIPKNIKDSHSFNHSDLLLSATCFEGLFKEYHPNFKAVCNKDFKKVKDDFLAFADKYLSSEELSKNEKRYAKKFYDLIYYYDGLLEEIFNTAFKEHKEELSDLLTRLKSLITTTTDNYGSLYADIRNHFAHGDFFELGDNECFIYELLHALLYAMNLKAASIPKDKARKVIKNIFL